MSRRTLLFSLLVGFWCLPGRAAPSDPDYEALKILTRHCAACHQAADHPGALFLNQARLSEPETIALIKKLVKTSQMPPAHRNFKNTKDGKALIQWLKSKKASH